MVGHSFQVCLKFSISFCLPFNAEKYFLSFEMGMNIFIFPLFSQYSCFHYSLQLCALCCAFLHWRPRPFPIFPSIFSLLGLQRAKSLSESSRGQCCAESISSLGSASIFFGNQEAECYLLNVIYRLA